MAVSSMLIGTLLGDSAPLFAQGGLVCQTPAPGNYWPLDEVIPGTYEDLINGDDAICTGANCPVPNPTGVVSNGQTFSLTTNVTVTASASATAPFDWAGTDDFSVEFWARSSCTGANGGVEVFVGRDDPSASQMSWWIGCLPDGRAQFYLEDFGGTTDTVISTATVNDNNWHHFIGVRDGVANMTDLYIDGISAGASTGVTFPTNFDSTIAPLTIGYYQSGFNTVGDLDEIAIYNDALTPAEVSARFSGGVAGQPVCFPNTAPTAVDDPNYSTPEDVTLTIAAPGVLGNDTDPDPGTTVLTATLSTGPSNGTVILNADGSFVYTPTANFNGPDTFTYQATDGLASSNTATVTVTVSAVNDPPTAVDDGFTTNEDTTLTIAASTLLANDTEIDAGDTITVTAVGTAANGSAALTLPSVTYTPAANFSGVDTFSYTIEDSGGLTSTANISVTVLPVSDAPIAVDDTITTTEETTVEIFVLTNDSDSDGDPLLISAISSPSNGAFVSNGTVITYTPNLNFNGIEVLTYTISDTVGLTDTAILTINITAVNDAPIAVDDSATTPANTPIMVTVLVNDSDVDGDPLTVTTTSTPTNGAASTDGSTVTYSPNAGFFGTDQFSYTISDGTVTATATVSVTVGANSVPVAVDDAATAAEDTAVTLSVLANDSDAEGDPLTIIALGTPTNGAISSDGTTVVYTPTLNFNGTEVITYTIDDNSAGTGSGGSATATMTFTITAVNDLPLAVDDTASTILNTATSISVLSNDSDIDDDPLAVAALGAVANGTASISGATVTYTPTFGFTGTDVFTYTLDDGNGGSDTATITVTVNTFNTPPVAVDDSATAPEDTAIVISVLANDSDAQNDPLTVTISTAAANGSSSTDGSTITYTPTLDFNGSDTLEYTISDGNGGSDSAVVTIDVSAVNDAPEASDDVGTTAFNSPVTLLVLSNDSDVEGDSLTVSSVGAAVNGATSTDGTSIVYTPTAGFSGTDTFTYMIDDGNGATDTATVTVTVSTTTNNAPLAVDDAISLDEDSPLVITVLGNDSDPDGDALTVSAVGMPVNGWVATDGTTVTYTPNLNFSGVDSVSYTIDDGNGNTASALILVTVESVNDLPVAMDDVSATPNDTPLNISVLFNDSDIDGDTLTVSMVSTPTVGTASTDGTIVTYTPSTSFSGTEVFSYTVSDGNGGSASAMITINISNVNNNPTANNDTVTLTGLQPITIDVLANDQDSDGNSLTISALTAPTSGIATTDGTTIVYTPTLTFSGSDIFTYFISDGNGGSGSASVMITAGLIDSDGDSIPDNVECSNPADCPDTDGDGTFNQFDADDDDDGILTINEALVDVNGNGISDHLEKLVIPPSPTMILLPFIATQ